MDGNYSGIPEGKKEKKGKKSLILNAYTEISIPCLKANKLTNQTENKSAKINTKVYFFYQIDGKSYQKMVRLFLTYHFPTC